jgi:hypothetical protein
MCPKRCPKKEKKSKRNRLLAKIHEEREEQRLTSPPKE